MSDEIKTLTRAAAIYQAEAEATEAWRLVDKAVRQHRRVKPLLAVAGARSIEAQRVRQAASDSACTGWGWLKFAD